MTTNREKTGTANEVVGDVRPDQSTEAETTAPVDDVRRDEVDWKDKFLRSKADFQNLQRRAMEEQRASLRYANSDFARSLLEAMDDFERTLEAQRPTGIEDPVTAGVRLIHGKLAKILRDHHVEVIQSLGHPFDPRLHEALLQQPSADHAPGTVIQEAQKGYKLHDRVLRPARVIVAKSPQPEVDGAANVADDPS